VVSWLSSSACVGLDQCSYSTSGPVSTWMGDRLRAGVNHLGM